MKQYKLQELVGTTRKLPRAESLFYETLISFRKLPECAQLFLPLKLQTPKINRTPSRTSGASRKSDEEVKNQCSKDDGEVQSYLEWKNFMSWIKLSSLKQFRRLRKSIVYILPIGPFPENMLVSLVSPQLTFVQSLMSYCEAFFPGMTFKLLPQIEYKEIGCKTRIHRKSGQLQLLLPDVMQYLSKVAPKNSIGIIGLSWVDFFPGYEWNHILGEGSVHNGCAAISFGHYAMFSNQESGSTMSSQGRTDTESIPSQGKTTLPCEIPITTTNREAERQPHLSKSFRENRFSRSVTKARKKRAISCTDISIPHSSPISNMLSSAPLNRSSRSLQTLGSLPSIHNSWTRIFSALSTSLSLSTTSSVDDASYDIINREEVESNFVNHGVEEDVIKLAIPVGCAFDVSCQTMWRLFKGITHEVCHIFGLSHCNFYECAMNGSRHVNEVDEQPLFLCPVCLRKLQNFLKFRLLSRYRKMREVLQNMSPCYVEKIAVNREGYHIDTEPNMLHYGDRNIRTRDENFGMRVMSHGTRTESHGIGADNQGIGTEDHGIGAENHGIPQVWDSVSLHNETPARHICIEVTREKNEDYDVINVEYRERGEDQMAYDQHECHFTQTLDKLDDIVSFLKRH